MSWPVATLSEVCEINPKLPKGTDESQKVSFLQMSSVSESGELLEQEERVLRETKKGFTYFERGDVLLAKITPCFENGKALFTDRIDHEIGYGSTEFHVLRSKEGIADGKYLFYLVWNSIFRYYGKYAMKGAAGQKRVGADFLKKFKIPLPPLAEQKKIAAILDAADQLRQKDQQLIDHYTTLSQSLFLEMFGDPVSNPMGFVKTSIGEQCDVKGGKRIPKGKKLVTENTGFPYIKAGNIKNGNVTTDNLEYVTNEVREKIQRYTVSEGDVCLTVVGVNIGDVGIVPKTLHNASLTENANKLLIKNTDALDNIYLSFCLRSMYMQNQIRKRTMAVGVPKLALFRIQQLEMLLPPKELQGEFKNRLASIEMQKDKAQFCAQKSQLLFNSLLQKAFKGELTSSKAA